MNLLPPENYVIRVKWVGPLEGTEYRVYLRGGDEMLAVRKSWQAAVNAAQQLNAVDAAPVAASDEPGEQSGSRN